MGFGTILWNDHVRVLRPGDDDRPDQPAGGGYVPAPRVTAFDTLVPWEEVLQLEAVQPWPSLRVRWRPADGVAEREQVHHPRGPRGPLPRTAPSVEAMETAGRHVEELFAWLREARPELAERIVPGWTELVDTPWERTEGLPKGRPAGGGAYRTSGRSRRVVGQRVVARRPRPNVTELLLAWVTMSKHKPWKETLREAVMTDDHLYVELWDRTTWRLPLSALTTRVDDAGASSDAVYVFGKRTFLVLTERRGDEVTRRLDLLLASRAA